MAIKQEAKAIARITNSKKKSSKMSLFMHSLYYISRYLSFIPAFYFLVSLRQFKLPDYYVLIASLSFPPSKLALHIILNGHLQWTQFPFDQIDSGKKKSLIVWPGSGVKSITTEGQSCMSTEFLSEREISHQKYE